MISPRFTSRRSTFYSVSAYRSECLKSSCLDLFLCVSVWQKPVEEDVCSLFTHLCVPAACNLTKVQMEAVNVILWVGRSWHCCVFVFATPRLLPDQAVFSSVVVLLQSVQEQGDCVLPRSVLRSALYLLAVTQDRSPSLNGVSPISSPNRERTRGCSATAAMHNFINLTVWRCCTLFNNALTAEETRLQALGRTQFKCPGP